MVYLVIAGYAPSLLGFRGPLISALQEKGMHVHVAAPELPPGDAVRVQLEAKGLVVHNIPLQRTGTNPLRDFRSLWSLWRLLRRVQPHYLLSYTVKPVIYGTLAAWLAGVPHRFALITGLGYAFMEQSSGSGPKRGRVKALVQSLYFHALAKAHKVFFQNPDDEAVFRRLGLLPPAVPSVVVNGSGVDVTAYAVAPQPATGMQFLLIARLLGDKGVREYAEAARRIRATNPSVHFALVGWIDSNPDSISQQELDRWVNEGTVKYLGRLSDVRPAIACSHVYVLPSYREGTPRTVLEAMAMGRAVITTDAPGCKETVVDGHNGFLVSVKSVDALEQAMLKFVNDPSLVTRMGNRSRRVAEEKYDVHKVNAIMLEEMEIL